MLLRGKWVEVDQAKLKEALDHWNQVAQEHPDGIDYIAGMRLLSGTSLSAPDEAVEDDVASWSRITAGAWLRETLESLRKPESIDALQPGRDLQATLRPYQADGVRWLWFMLKLGLGACLADDMGLGKTIQIIDLLLQRKREAGEKKQPPSLLVVPASLIGNWRQELARFAPSLTIFFAHRSEVSAEVLDRVSAKPARELAKFDLVITTYALVRRQNWIAKMNWSLAVLDEAQAIKNSGSAQTKSVKKIPATARIVLTGTPVENHLGDLWSLFDFCSPGLLGSAAEFKKFVNRLNKEQNPQAFGSLRRLVRPYILRRMKTDPDIVPDLPEKIEMRAECGLSKKQAVLYEKTVTDLANRLEISEGIARRGLVLATLMQLKQICNHPNQFLAGGTAFRLMKAASSSGWRRSASPSPTARRKRSCSRNSSRSRSRWPITWRRCSVEWGWCCTAARRWASVPSWCARKFQGRSGAALFRRFAESGRQRVESNRCLARNSLRPVVESGRGKSGDRQGLSHRPKAQRVGSQVRFAGGRWKERIDQMITNKQKPWPINFWARKPKPSSPEMSDDELLRFVSLDIGRATAEE